MIYNIYDIVMVNLMIYNVMAMGGGECMTLWDRSTEIYLYNKESMINTSSLLAITSKSTKRTKEGV